MPCPIAGGATARRCVLRIVLASVVPVTAEYRRRLQPVSNARFLFLLNGFACPAPSAAGYCHTELRCRWRWVSGVGLPGGGWTKRERVLRSMSWGVFLGVLPRVKVGHRLHRCWRYRCGAVVAAAG